MTKEEKGEKILRAASDCFARYGYEKTTLEEIGKAVGLNKASLYYYYKNKESIFCDVLYRETDQYMQELHKKLNLSGTVKEKIMLYLGERLNYYRLVVNLHNLSVDTVKKVEPVFMEVYTKVLVKESTFLTAYITEGINNGEFEQVDAKKVADSLLLVATSIRYRALHISYVNMAMEANFHEILEEIRFVSALMINGISSKN